MIAEIALVKDDCSFGSHSGEAAGVSKFGRFAHDGRQHGLITFTIPAAPAFAKTAHALARFCWGLIPFRSEALYVCGIG